MLTDQLGKVLVAGGDQRVQLVAGRLQGQRPDHIVRFNTLYYQQGQAHGADNLVDGFDLAAQFIGHWRARGLVVSKNIIAKGLALGIEDHRDIAVGILFGKQADHADNALDGAGGLTLAAYQWWQGMEGAIFQMLSHGIVSAALFLCVGVVYDRLHTREIDRYGGLANNMPRYALVFMVFMLASVGLPGTSGFVGEFLVIMGSFQISTWLGLLVASGMVLGASYMLLLYRRVTFGTITREDVRRMLDMNWREKLVFAPLIVLALVFGVYPMPVLDVMSASVENLIDNYQLALGEQAAPNLLAQLLPQRWGGAL